MLVVQANPSTDAMRKSFIANALQCDEEECKLAL